MGRKWISSKYVRWGDDWSEDWRGMGINPTPILIHTITGWAGLSAVWYGVNLAMDGNNAVAVPWLVIGSLLGITSLWVDLDNRIERSRAWNRWLNEEHGQIREAQSINADAMHEDVVRCQNQVDDLNEKMEQMESNLRDECNRAETELRREIFSHMEAMERGFNERVTEVDRAVGDVMRRCDETCHTSKK